MRSPVISTRPERKKTQSPLIALVVLAAALSVSCHSVVIVMGTERPPISNSVTVEPIRKERQGNIVMGIYSQDSEPEPIVCKKNQQPEVKIVTDFKDNVIHFFIGPFYSTKTVEIYCR